MGWCVVYLLIACSHHYNVRNRSRYVFVFAVGYYILHGRIKKQTSDVSPHCTAAMHEANLRFEIQIGFSSDIAANCSPVLGPAQETHTVNIASVAASVTQF